MGVFRIKKLKNPETVKLYSHLHTGFAKFWKGFFNCSQQNLADLDSWKPNFALQHGAFKENINYCEISHNIMQTGKQRNREQCAKGCNLWVGAII